MEHDRREERTRPATSADEAAVARLDERTWSPEVTPSEEPSRTPPFARASPSDHVVLEVGGDVVGYIKLGHPTELASNQHVVEIQGLAVDPDHQGRGYGARLITAGIAEARRRGARKVSLRVLAPNTAAQALYQRMGFTVQGRLVGEFLIGGQLVDDVLMALPLGDSSP